MKLVPRSYLVLWSTVLFLYVAVRLWGLTSGCLWFDEIFSVHAAEHDGPGLWHFVALDLIHPPLFYAVLKLWIMIGGESLLWLRLLPVLFSVAAIYPFVRLWNELFNGLRIWPQLLALILNAVNGSLIKYSQEVRMYSMLMCLSLFSMWLCARYGRSGRGLAVWTIVNVLMVWTHYFGWLVMAAELCAVVCLYRNRWRGMAVNLALTVCAFLPWLSAVLSAKTDNGGLEQNIGWMSQPGFQSVAQFALALLEPFYFQASSVDAFSIYRVSVPLVLLTGTAIVLWFIDRRLQNADEKRAFKAAAIFAAVPAVAAFCLSWILPLSIWGTRHLIIVFAPAAMVVSLSVSRVRWQRLRTAAVTLIVLLTSYALVFRATRSDPEYIWCAWEQLARKLDTKSPTRVYATEDAIAYHLWFAMRHEPNVTISKLEAGMPEDRAYFLPRGFDEVTRSSLDEVNDEHFWLVYRTQGPSTAAFAQEAFPGKSVVGTYETEIQNTHAFLLELRSASRP